jgi:hypothetical protein
VPEVVEVLQRAHSGDDAKSLSNHLTDRLNGQPEIRPDSVNDVVLI